MPVQSRNSSAGNPGSGAGSGTGAGAVTGGEAGGAGMFSPRTATGGRCDGPTVHPASSAATHEQQAGDHRPPRGPRSGRSAAPVPDPVHFPSTLPVRR